MFGQVTTEDGEALDPEAAAQGLTLRLAPPSSGRADEVVLSPAPGVQPFQAARHTPSRALWLCCPTVLDTSPCALHAVTPWQCGQGTGRSVA